MARAKLATLVQTVVVLLSCCLCSTALNAQQPKRGGTLTSLQFLTPNTLNPVVQHGVYTGIFGSNLFASLLQLDDKWQPLPYLAERWSVSSDGLAYTLHLNPNALFHDDKPITSEDVAFSIMLVKENHAFGPLMLANVKEVQTPDPHTAIIQLSQPSPTLLVALSSPCLTPILPKHVFGTEPIRTHPRNNSPVGSGPFKLAEYKPGQHIILERFDRFFRPGRPYLDRIVYPIIRDSSAATLALSKGDVQYAAYPAIPLTDIDRLAKQPNLVVTTKGTEAFGAVAWIQFNLRKKPLLDLPVRQAIAYSIDRQFITQQLHLGRSKPAAGPITETSPFYNPGLMPYAVDLEHANKLLDDAGYPRDDKGVRFSLRLDWPPGTPDNTRVIAEYLKPQLRKVGIDIQLRPSPDFPTWAQRVAAWDFDMTLEVPAAWGDPAIGAGRVFVSTNIRNVVGSNVGGYVNREVDEILSQAGATLDTAKRRELYYRFQKIVNEELPGAWTIQPAYYTVYNRMVRNVPLSVWGVFAPFDEVYLDSEKN